MTVAAMPDAIKAAYDQLDAGDRVEVTIDIPSPFGNGQMATFDIEAVNPDDGTIIGVDPNWGDTVELVGTGSLHYAGSGKSGDVAEVRVMETTDDGVTIHGSETVVYSAGGQR